MVTAPLGLNESGIWANVIAPPTRGMTVEHATHILTWGFTDEEKERMAELAAKARDGTLSAAEKAEADNYSRVDSVIGILKSKARRALKSHAADAV